MYDCHSFILGQRAEMVPPTRQQASLATDSYASHFLAKHCLAFYHLRKRVFFGRLRSRVVQFHLFDNETERLCFSAAKKTRCAVDKKTKQCLARKDLRMNRC